MKVEGLHWGIDFHNIDAKDIFPIPYLGIESTQDIIKKMVHLENGTMDDWNMFATKKDKLPWPLLVFPCTFAIDIIFYLWKI